MDNSTLSIGHIVKNFVLDNIVLGVKLVVSNLDAAVVHMVQSQSRQRNSTTTSVFVILLHMGDEQILFSWLLRERRSASRALVAGPRNRELRDFKLVGTVLPWFP